jgi:hypothetical protein
MHASVIFRWKARPPLTFIRQKSEEWGQKQIKRSKGQGTHEEVASPKDDGESDRPAKEVGKGEEVSTDGLEMVDGMPVDVGSIVVEVEPIG